MALRGSVPRATAEARSRSGPPTTEGRRHLPPRRKEEHTMRVVAHSYDSYDQAARVVDALERAGVPRDDITLISGDKSRTAATGTTKDTSSGAGTGATVGAAVGGGAGLLAGLGSLAIPGV